MICEERVVLFADVLGFAALTESHPIDLNQLKKHDRLLSPSLDLNDAFEWCNNLLTKTFSNFHFLLRAVIDLASKRFPMTAITFSDSAFVATTHAHEAVDIAIDLMQSLLTSSVPVRMAIAYGSFAALRFRSDITSDSGDHAAQFLGTAVVRAHAAETCGIKGLRILLHPSVMPLLRNNTESLLNSEHISIHNCCLECSPSEMQNKAGVTYELDYWHFRPTREAEAWRALQDMWKNAPLSEEVHYKATAEAIDRMRMAQGHDAMKTLRRRTLPR